MISRGAADLMCVGLVKDPHAQQPHREAHEGDLDSIAAALNRSAFERRRNCHRGEPSHDVVVDDEDLGQCGIFESSFPGQNTGDAARILVITSPTTPGKELSKIPH